MGGAWPGTLCCDECGTWYAAAQFCPKCGPPGKVKCPYSLASGHDPRCSACKGYGWLDELKP